MTEAQKQLINMLNDLEESILEDDEITGGDIDRWIEEEDGDECLVNIQHARDQVAKGEDLEEIRYMMDHMRPTDWYDAGVVADL
jgi:hypothetical protein